MTGISGNYFLDPETGREVMMNSASFLRCETILTAAARTGRRVAMVTAKDKLRDLLCKDLGGLSLSTPEPLDQLLPIDRQLHGLPYFPVRRPDFET